MNTSILINNIMCEYVKALSELQECASIHENREIARAKVDVCNSIISNMLSLEINECIRCNEKHSFIGISKFDKDGKIISHERFSVSSALEFISSALKLKVLYE